MNSEGQVLERVVGGKQTDPWYAVVAQARVHLVETSHFLRVDNPAGHGLGRLFHASYKLVPESATIAGSTREITWVRAFMQEIQGLDRHRWNLLASHVDKALEAMEEKDDDR